MERGNGKPGAVILGGSFHSLGAARNLAKHGVPVCILDIGACVARFSRSVKRFLKCPAADDEAGFVEFLVRIAAESNMGSVGDGNAIGVEWYKTHRVYRTTL